MQVRSTVWVLLIAIAAALGLGFGVWRSRNSPSSEEAQVSPALGEVVGGPSAGGTLRLASKMGAPAIAYPRPLPSAPAVAALPAGKTRTLEETTAYLRDDGASAEDRRVALEGLGQREDAEAVNALICVAETMPAFREHAVMLLGRGKSDLAAAFLATQLTNEDERVTCRAVVGLAQIKGVDAILAIGAVAENNRNRTGGPSDAIWESCAMALGEIRSGEALPLIERELKWVGENNPNLMRFEYGSRLVSALEHIGDSRAADMLHAYADHLQASLSGMPKMRQVQMVKIMETRKIAESLK